VSRDQHERARFLVSTTQVPPQFDWLIITSAVCPDHVEETVIFEVSGAPTIVVFSGCLVNSDGGSRHQVHLC